MSENSQQILALSTEQLDLKDYVDELNESLVPPVLNAHGDNLAIAGSDTIQYYIRIVNASSNISKSKLWDEAITAMEFAEVGVKTFLFVGFKNGIVRVLDVNCLNVFEQLIDEASVMKIKLSKKYSTRKVGHLIIAFSSFLAHVTNTDLVDTLLKNSIDDGVETNVWNVSKFDIGVKDITDMTVVNPIESLRDEVTELSLEPINPLTYAPQQKLYIVVSGREPSLAYAEIEENSHRFSVRDFAKKAAGELVSGMFSFAKRSFWGSDTKNVREETVLRLAKEVPTRYRQASHIHDKKRIIRSVTQSACGQFLATTDSFGRVMVLDLYTFSIIQLLKGYRDASCGWITIEIKQRLSKKQSFLLVYLPMRGLLEVYRMGINHRFGAMNVGKGCKLVFRKNSDGENRVYLIRRDGVFQQVHLSGSYCSNPSLFTPQTKTETATACRQLKTLLGEWQQRASEIMDVFAGLKTPRKLDECINVILRHKVEWEETSIFCERLVKFISRASQNIASQPNKPSTETYDRMIRLIQSYSVLVLSSENSVSVPLQIPPVPQARFNEPPDLSLLQFVNFFSPPISEDLLPGSKALFGRILKNGNEETTITLPPLVLDQLQLQPEFLTKLFLTWFENLRSEHFNVVPTISDLPLYFQTQMQSKSGVDWLEPKLDTFFSNSLTKFEEKFVPTVKYLIYRSGHFVNGVREFCFSSSKMCHVYLLSRIIDAVINQTRATEEPVWIILVSRAFKLQIVQLLLPLENLAVGIFNKDFCISRFASLTLLHETSTFRNNREEYISKVKEILLLLCEPEATIQDSSSKKKSSDGSLAQRLCLLSRAFPGHVTSSSVGFYLLHSIMENMYPLLEGSMSDLSMELFYFHTFAEATWNPEELESFGLCLQCWDRIISRSLNSILEHPDRMKDQIGVVLALIRSSVNILKLIETMAKQIVSTGGNKKIYSKEFENSQLKAEDKSLTVENLLIDQSNESELSVWPPKETHERFTTRFKKLALQCLSKPIHVNSVYLTIKQYLGLLRLLFVWHKNSLPFCSKGFVVAPPGSKSSKDVSFCSIFPSFRRFEPGAFSILKLQETNVNLQTANSTSGIRFDVVMGVARKDIRMSLNLASDWELDIDLVRREITVCLYNLNKDGKAMKMLNEIEDKVAMAHKLMEIGKDRLAGELRIAMKTPKLQDLLSQIPADLVQELVGRIPPNTQVKKLSPRQLEATITLLRKVDSFFKRSSKELAPRITRQPPQLVRIVQLLCGEEMINVN